LFSARPILKLKDMNDKQQKRNQTFISRREMFRKGTIAGVVLAAEGYSGQWLLGQSAARTLPNQS
jgi:hypothetical protein